MHDARAGESSVGAMRFETMSESTKHERLKRICQFGRSRSSSSRSVTCIHCRAHSAQLLIGLATSNAAGYIINPLKPSSSNCYTLCHTCLTYQFLISDIRPLWRSALSARVPECQKLKTDRLGLYGVEYSKCYCTMTMGFKRLTARQSFASAVYATANPSVRLSHSGSVSK